MENVQRAVMLLRPDAHIVGQWDSGATLKLQALPGGISLSLRMDGHFGAGGVLTLFMRDGSPHPVGEVTSASLQVKEGGIRFADVMGAAVIQDDRFVLKSPMPDWPAVIARYRFAQKQTAAPREEMEAREAALLREAGPMTAPPVQTEVPQEMEVPQEIELPQQINMPLQDMTQQSMYENGQGASDEPDEVDYPPQQISPQEPEDECPGGVRQYHIDPFPGEFPGSEWVKISYPGPAGWWHYIFGRMRVNDADTDVIGVPGEYSMAPPVWLDGFSTWVRCASGDARGYWLMFQDPQTGQVLDINRSRRGG